MAADDPVRVIACGPGDGPSADVAGDPRAVVARKRERVLQVAFARADGTVHTLEGDVPVAAGDAVVRGPHGESWPVARDRFEAKYQPVPPTRAGDDGLYLTLALTVLAVRLDAAADVLLPGGAARLHGRPGDWVVDHGDGTLGVVGGAIFGTLYDVLPASAARG